jgi:hypothetical protein
MNAARTNNCPACERLRMWKKGRRKVETNQPKWKQVGTLGDINFIDYDGGPVFVDETGIYPPELEYVQNTPESDGDAYVYRFPLNSLKLSPAGKLIPAKYDVTWPHPIESYTEWFDKDISSLASSIGMERHEFVSELISENPMTRARAYEELAQYLGWENFDSYPLHFKSREELEARYERHPYLTMD